MASLRRTRPERLISCEMIEKRGLTLNYALDKMRAPRAFGVVTIYHHQRLSIPPSVISQKFVIP